MARKLLAGRVEVDPANLAREHVLHMAFTRSAERAMKLPLRVQSCLAAVRSSAEIAESLPENGLLLLTEGPEDGVGLVVVAPDALGCLIEVMTTGHLRDHAPLPRRPTRTDAAMAAGFVDTVLAEIETLLSESDDVIWAGGFRYTSHLPDPRPLAIMLEEPAYRVFRLRLAFGFPDGPQGDVRCGEVWLAYPAHGRGQPPQKTSADAPADNGLQQELAWARGLELALMPATVAVDAVLARVTLPLSVVLALEAGQSLTLPSGALQLVQLQGADNATLCLGQLGQTDGHRALRLQLADTGLSGGAKVPPVKPADLVPARDQPLSRPGARGKAGAEAPPATLSTPESPPQTDKEIAPATAEPELSALALALAG